MINIFTQACKLLTFQSVLYTIVRLIGEFCSWLAYCVRLFVRIVLTRVFEDVVDFHLDYGLPESSLYADPQAEADVEAETDAVHVGSAKRTD